MEKIPENIDFMWDDMSTDFGSLRYMDFDLLRDEIYSRLDLDQAIEPPEGISRRTEGKRLILCSLPRMSNDSLDALLRLIPRKQMGTIIKWLIEHEDVITMGDDEDMNQELEGKNEIIDFPRPPSCISGMISDYMGLECYPELFGYESQIDLVNRLLWQRRKYLLDWKRHHNPDDTEEERKNIQPYTAREVLEEGKLIIFNMALPYSIPDKILDDIIEMMHSINNRRLGSVLTQMRNGDNWF